MCLRKYFRALVTSPNYSNEQIPVEEIVDCEKSDQLLYDYALMRLMKQFDLLTYLEDKCEKLMGFDAVVAGGVFAVTKSSRQELAAWSIAGLVSIVLSILVLLRARRAFTKPSPPKISEVLEDLHKSPRRHAWMAASFHSTVLQLQIAQEHIADLLELATWLTVLGLSCLCLSLIPWEYLLCFF